MADIPAGLAYLGAGLAFTVAEVVLIRNRHHLARSWLDQWLSAGAAAPRGLRWTSVTRAARDERWQDAEFREKQLVWLWLPFALFLPVAALVMLAGGVTEMLR